MTMYSNAPEPVKMRGVELEALYDAGFAFTKLSLSKEHTSQPTNRASNVFGAGDVSELPEFYFTLDSGVRLLDEKLTLGGVVKYTGKSVRLSPDSDYDENEQLLKEPAPHIPTIIDLYGTYQVNRNLLLKLSVQNLMDKDYSDALNKMNSLPSQSQYETPTNTARGRTYIFGGEVRFKPQRNGRSSSQRPFRLQQPFVQLVGELLAVALVQRVRAAGLDAAGAQGIHKIAHVEALADGVRRIAFATRVQRHRAFLYHLCRQRNVGGDHQIARFAAAHDRYRPRRSRPPPAANGCTSTAACAAVGSLPASR